MNDPDGVEVSGMIYGGRDSDTWVPVKGSFSWEHGILTMASCLESETTSATLGATGVRNFNPSSNLDFLCVPIGDYIDMQLDFKDKLSDVPKIFSVNYFLEGRGRRIPKRHKGQAGLDEVDGLTLPGRGRRHPDASGKIPKYEDLKRLFREVHDKEYTREEYRRQFTLRIPEHLEKIDRMVETYENRVKNTPQSLYDKLEEQRKRLEEAREKHGDYLSPETFN